MSEPTMNEIAERIHAYLKRFEADPTINIPIGKSGVSRFWNSSAYYHRGPKISVTYIGFQGSSKLSKAEALAYLEWLDAGNVGRHYAVVRGVA